jgi:hypothetical protein
MFDDTLIQNSKRDAQEKSKHAQTQHFKSHSPTFHELYEHPDIELFLLPDCPLCSSPSER